MLEKIISFFLQNIGSVISLFSKIKKPLPPNSSLKQSKDIRIIEVEDFYVELNSLMNKAEKEFIFIAGSMMRLEASYETIWKLLDEKNINFRILALNIEEMALKTEFKKMLALGISPAPNLDHLRKLIIKKNCKIHIYDYIPTSYFIGIDIEDKEKGVIRVVNFLHGMEERKYPHLEINSKNSEWYDFYKNHILSLWDNSTPLNLKKK